MFKLESYIAPILLSYVDKYIKNFRLEDSQVSLWGGDASFHNLDLRLEVLEQELQSPFSFISGHIRELLIHVPWTKLTSEPITITINTIECVLKLKDANDSTQADSSPAKDHKKKLHQHSKQEVEAPPNYVQLLINKIVNNIRIYCNNLILKYVEEDIVLSMNVKLLKVESCNEKWEAAYTDPSGIQVTMRKVISVNDLTVCLDKRNAAGKIDFYQEPMLYRCSMTMHLLRTYSSTSTKTSLTRLDIFCNSMEFSVTEQQVPMFYRLIVLITALQQKQLKSQIDILENSATSLETKEEANNLTWTGWAWSYVTSVLPTQWDENLDNSQLLNQAGHVVQIGFYVDNAALTFKVSETSTDRNYYSQKKVRYYPLLTLQLQGIYSELVTVGRKWSNSSFGISEILLLPLGPCSCSHPETTDTLPYLAIGSKTSSHKSNSLFDAEAVENSGQGQFRNYNTNWEFHMFTQTEAVLLERTPALACDFLYQMELPEDASSDILSDLGSNLEFSNMAERVSIRICFGSLKFRICSGLFHRMNSLEVAASSYDYPSYTVPKTELQLHELLPPSEEDFDALNEFIPTRSLKIMIYEPIIELQFMDHPHFEPSKGNLFRKSKRLVPNQLSGMQLAKLPRITMECKSIGIFLTSPMYVNRLIHTTCQLPEPPTKMFDACFSKIDINIVGVSSRLYLRQNHQTIIIVPFNLNVNLKNILLPHCWVNSDIIHNEIVIEAENLTFNCTNAKFIIINHLIDNVMKQNVDGLKNLKCTSLLYDACRDHSMPYLELNFEGFKFRKVATNSTVALEMGLDSIKAFVFESNNDSQMKMNNIQQVLFLSGPENKNATKKNKETNTNELVLFRASVQYPLKPETQPHPTLVIFHMEEINVCVDPLVCKWFLYHPSEFFNTKTVPNAVSVTTHERLVSKKSETFSSTVSETPRKISSQLESIHSNSERDLLVGATTTTPELTQIDELNQNEELTALKQVEDVVKMDWQEKIYDFLKKWHVVWKSMVLNGHIAQCVIYFPMASISSVGSQNVAEAIKDALNKKLIPNVMVITLPSATIQSAQKQSVEKYLKEFPIKLPESIWQTNRASFPWTMSIKDLTCYSLEKGKEISFVKKVGLSATVGLSTKQPQQTSSTEMKENLEFTPSEHMGCLGVYVHIDVTPLVISVSEMQMALLASLVYGLSDFFASLRPKPSLRPDFQSDSNLSTLTLVASPSISPTAKEPTLDGTSGTTTVPTTIEELKNELHSDSENNVKLTAWLQWTMTKVSIELLSHESDQSQLKLVIDVEDIVSSLDYQNVYLKLKSKIGSISIQHYKQQHGKWQVGDFAGVVVRLREDVSIDKKPEDGGFIAMTLTRASSLHTHNLWGTMHHHQNRKEKKIASATTISNHIISSSTSRFITEIVVSVQPIDIVLSIKSLLSFYNIIAPFMSAHIDSDKDEISTKINVKATKKKLASFTNQNLPLTYLECSEIRLIVPSYEMNGKNYGNNHRNDDVFIVQLSKISLSPSVTNPICRKPLRPDIYRQAAQARLLSVPGSELEDRQYQLDIIGMGISTTQWRELETLLNIRGNGTSAIIRENPAVEWNNLKQGKLLGMISNLKLTPVAEKIEICVVCAPMMLYKNEIVICASSFEINMVSDIEISLSLDQIKLMRAICNEIKLPEREILEAKRPSISFPYSRFETNSNCSDDVLFELGLSEFFKDSGIDSAEIRSVLSAKSQQQSQDGGSVKNHHAKSPNLLLNSFEQQPMDMLFTAGKISLCLYQGIYTTQGNNKKYSELDEDDENYEASEEESVDDVKIKVNNASQQQKKNLPLIFLQLSQPNAYSSTQQFVSRTHVSCFDFAIKLNENKKKRVTKIPGIDDFAIDLIQTRSGYPDATTGIRPAFFTLKYVKECGKNVNLHGTIGKPTKFDCSLSKLENLIELQVKLNEQLESTTGQAEKTESISNQSTTFRKIKDLLRGIDLIQFKTDQLVFNMDTKHDQNVCLTIGKMKNKVFVCERPEKMTFFTNFECMTISLKNERFQRLLLNPWTVSIELSMFLESWQINHHHHHENVNKIEPQIHLNVDSESIVIDFSPEHLILIRSLLKDLNDFSNMFGEKVAAKNVIVPENLVENTVVVEEKDQHYKDDLRAGAFQFIEATNSNGEELPLPYQVMFWNYKEMSAMAWRYPQPRALTKVRIFPVPLETNTKSMKIVCNLQYWSEYHCTYLNYAKFELSESEVCYLDLPKNEPQRAVAYIWRVILTTVDVENGGEKVEKNLISPRALAACMRIDSYFNKLIVPNLTLSVYISQIELCLFSNFYSEKPFQLDQFSCDWLLPESHCFTRLQMDNTRIHLAKWTSDQMFYLDFGSTTKCLILDYGFLKEKMLFEQFQWKFDVNLAQNLKVALIAKPIELNFSADISHTLAVNLQLWNNTLNHDNAKKKNKDLCSIVIFTKLVICNDTNINMRFGQVGTDEDIFLASRNFHMYCWRSTKSTKKLRVAFEDFMWTWSKPFSVDEDLTQIIPIDTNLNVVVTIKSLNSNQKQIVINGQFTIANMLLEHFEFKLICKEEASKEKKNLQFLGGKTITSSMFLNEKSAYFFRLRFFGLDSAWTGDIPLREHTKGAQPWLVKVPLQERGQFLSIWCRIIVQENEQGRRILAMLWPLFMVKSNLPVLSKIHIETPTLNVHLDSIVKGKGEMQQLYCPGTIDHSHQLTFKLHDGTSISDPYIPLNYSLVDQQKFFKKTSSHDKDNNINEIVASLRDFDKIKWPNFGDDYLDGIEWVVEEQPQTTIQVKYQNACQYSSALLVELLPWCLMVNTFGCPISLMANGTELCRLPQYGIVAPPKLNDTFHLGVELFGVSGWAYSGPLQLATSDWSQTFYMPKISGTLPMDGVVKTAVKCGGDIAMVSISSTISSEIRLLKVSSTHIFTNFMPQQVNVACFAIPECDNLFDLPSNVDKIAFSAAPQKNTTSGISIVRWNVLIDEYNNKIYDSNTTYLLYITFSFTYGQWSCPVRCDDGLTRKSLAVMGADNKSLPMVLISQEIKGQTYLSLYHDSSPQLLIDNQSPVNLVCAQSLSDESDVAMESPHFKWMRKIESGQCLYYTMPFISEKFPELPQTCFAERIVFAKETRNDAIEWSTPISVTNDMEQYVKIPNYGDVKLVVKVTTLTTLICVECVSRVEINAIDIRGRLTKHEKESTNKELRKSSIEIVHSNSLKANESCESNSLILKLPLYKKLFRPTIPLDGKPWQGVEIAIYLKSFSVIFLEESDEDLDKHGVASLTFDGIGVELKQAERLNVNLTMSDIQFDNQYYEKGSYDFPVVLVSQEKQVEKTWNIFDVTINDLIENGKNNNPLLNLQTIVESWRCDSGTRSGLKEIRIKINPLSFYIEDIYVNKLMEYFNGLIPNKAILGSGQSEVKFAQTTYKSINVRIPEEIFWQSSVIARPLNLKTIIIEPLSLLLSIHSSLKMYIALDQSPLQFNRFERRRLLTTHYRLGHAMTMHYLSGAIFGAGWVVSSLELLGSPSGLARAMGTGLRDFINLPYRGLVQGPWAFLRGVTHGSASLMKHVTAGTLQSVTKLASSVARNLDRLTLDDEHLKRTEEQRRMKPQGVTQGFMQGVTGLGISLLGAVGGIAHHPLQSIMTDGASPRSLAAGVGLGLVGVFTKPLSGAAELLALTGQGLLQGAGWNPMPLPRLVLLNLFPSDGNSSLKYEWKLLEGTIGYKGVLFASEATICNRQQSEMSGVVMVLTREALFVVNLDGDEVQRVLSLNQMEYVQSTSDPTLLSFKVVGSKVEKEEESVGDEMDSAARARVADYVKSTASLLIVPSNEVKENGDLVENGAERQVEEDNSSEIVNFYINPHVRNYFLCWLSIAKQKSNNNNYTFPVL